MNLVKKTFFKFFVCIILGVICFALEADAIDSLILNQTKTLKGQEFYREFCFYLAVSENQTIPSILIQENINPRSGNYIDIIIADNIVYRAGVYNRSNNISGLAKEGIRRTREYLVYKQLQKNFKKGKSIK